MLGFETNDVGNLSKFSRILLAVFFPWICPVIVKFSKPSFLLRYHHNLIQSFILIVMKSKN